MRTLQEAIDRMDNKGGAGASLRKHLNAVGIKTWDDISRNSLYEFRDKVLSSVAPSTARTVTAYLMSLLNRYSDCLKLPPDYTKILAVKGCKAVRTFLTPAELRAFEKYPARSITEELIKAESLVEAYTGARVSDVLCLTSENFHDGHLTYTSKKTRITVTLPASAKVKGWVEYIQTHKDYEPSMTSRGIIIRRIARGAGITEPVSVFRAGKTVKGPKCDHISSHNFRITFCTNLQIAGVDMLSLSRLAGHTNSAMTERYCSPTAPRLTENALAYLNL